jgi:hypothetical protein
MPQAPISPERLMMYVDCIINKTPEKIPPAITRLDYFLARIAGADISAPAPITSTELFLAKIAGDEVAVPAPYSRIDIFLAKIAGEDVITPVPVTAVEDALQEWLSNVERERNA